MSGDEEPLPDHIPQEVAEGLEKLFQRLDPFPEREEFEKLTGLTLSEGIPAAKVKSLKAVVGELMWLAYLPADEQETFWWELYTAMDEVHSTGRGHFGARVAMRVGPLLHEWKATAQAHADGLPEILAEVEKNGLEDFGPVEPPYLPKYAVHSIIDAGGPDRYRVMSVEEVPGHYVLRPLFSSAVRADLVLWAWQDCDGHTELEWVDDKPVYALKVHGQRLRTLSDDEAKTLGVKIDDQ